MSTEFPFVAIPLELAAAFGEKISGTRIYRKEGSQEEIRYWLDAVFAVCGHTVSPGGAAGYAQVSRAAIHKRMKEGNLTCFLFDITHRKRTLFGLTKNVREMEVALVPVSECKAWAEEINQRAINQGIVTEKELAGDVPDWHGDFLRWNSRWQKQQAGNARRKK